MASKRRPSPEFVPNPFVKKRNLAWTIQQPADRSTGDVVHIQTDAGLSNGDAPFQSPPPTVDRGKTDDMKTAAAIEAGTTTVTDHLARFSAILSDSTLSSFPDDTPRLRLDDYRELYERSFGRRDGAHFVIHQHDHPIAGTHYDLRLQINETSSASWAIMYGMPGDGNSIRLNRNATETRVHCLWNHLIECASHDTGSLLIWDTGTYTILPRRSKHAPKIDPSSQEEADPESGEGVRETEQEKLHRAFQNRKIKLRLHGTRLPENYTVYLRLTKLEDAEGRSKSERTPRRRRRGRVATTATTTPTTSSSEAETEADTDEQAAERGREDVLDHNLAAAASLTRADKLSEMEREIRELEDENVALTNAYPGAENSIGSIHQRRWYLSLDREACGLVPSRDRGRVVWTMPAVPGAQQKPQDMSHRAAFPFHVRGPEFERSIVTGRLGADILTDEGVEGFVRRQGWHPVLN